MFWGDEPGDCVFLDQPVPITDIKAAQKRVRSDKTETLSQGAKVTRLMIHHFFRLNLQSSVIRNMRVFPACTNAAELLKIQVGKLRLLNDDNSEVDLNSAAAINARHAT